MKIKMHSQPDDITCGPTCLHAVYNYFGIDLSLERVIGDITYLRDGGTLAVFLGIDALKRGLRTEIYTYNLKVFDPSWVGLDNCSLCEKLRQQLKYKKGKKFTQATMAYMDYLERGGKIRLEDLTPDLLHRYFDRKVPILAGLSATYLYNSKREFSVGDKSIYDDLKGEPMGHFVVLYGSDVDTNIIRVADPYKGNPISRNNYYEVEYSKLINSVMLGIVTYDANLLVITKAEDEI